MHHGAIEVVAYQETLLLIAVFFLAVLAMTWAGFRKWLQHKEKMSRLIADQTAERAARQDAQMDRVEARLNAIEQMVSDGSAGAPQIEAPGADLPADPALKPKV